MGVFLIVRRKLRFDVAPVLVGNKRFQKTKAMPTLFYAGEARKANKATLNFQRIHCLEYHRFNGGRASSAIERYSMSLLTRQKLQSVTASRYDFEKAVG